MANQDYELVVSVIEGRSLHAATGWVTFTAVSEPETTGNGVKLPRFSFVDRVPTVIDIAGFTRITEATVADVVKLSGLKIKEWFARKEFNEDQRPFLHLYVEIREDALESEALSRAGAEGALKCLLQLPGQRLQGPEEAFGHGTPRDNHIAVWNRGCIQEEKWEGREADKRFELRRIRAFGTSICRLCRDKGG